jgi:hypothetical protein
MWTVRAAVMFLGVRDHQERDRLRLALRGQRRIYYTAA